MEANMRTNFLATSAAVVALYFPVSAVAQQQEQQVAQECLQTLQTFNQELTETGYGLAGPRGYGVGAPAADPTTAPPYYGGVPTTPRGEIRALMDAALVLARNGNEDGCQTVVAEMRELYEQRRQQIAEGEPIPAEEVTAWRAQWLQAAVPVSEMEGSINLDQIIGSDVRSMQDEDLGDVEDIVLGADGGIEYVLVSHGGFLGMGGELVPVRWQDLRITPDPYRDTLVLPVQEAALENAPSVDGDVSEAVTSEEWRQQIDSYWEQAVDG
jgi:hypothetical protein